MSSTPLELRTLKNVNPGTLIPFNGAWSLEIQGLPPVTDAGHGSELAARENPSHSVAELRRVLTHDPVLLPTVNISFQAT